MSWTDSFVLALDLEGSGDRASENPTVEIGAIIKSPEGETIAKFHESGKCIDEQYEERCKKEFWDKVDKSGIKRKRYEESQDSYLLWKHFYEWIEENTKHLKSFIIVSDNPTYDCGTASYNFDRYFHGKSMHYVGGKGYIKIRDVHSAMEPLAELLGMKRKDLENKILENYYKEKKVEISDHDHNPLNDANKIANLWLAMVSFLKKNEGYGDWQTEVFDF
jgi:hypothetical protein